MTMMAFKGLSAGYSFGLVGTFVLGFTVPGGHRIYRYSGIGTGAVVASFMSRRPIMVPYNPILYNFQGQDVTFTIKGGVTGLSRTKIGLSIAYSGGNRAEAYNIAPSAPDNLIMVSVKGTIGGDAEYSGSTFHLLPPDSFLSRQLAQGLFEQELINATNWFLPW